MSGLGRGAAAKGLAEGSCGKLTAHFRVISSTSCQLLSSVLRMLCMPVSTPWYECWTSDSISFALRRSAGAKGWFHSVKM